MIKNILIVCAILISGESFSKDLHEEISKSLLESLQCRPNDSEKILEAFRNLEKKKSDLQKEGIEFSLTGEELDEKIVVKFKKPVDFLGAKTSQFELFLGGPFNVYADFSGAPETFIKKLNLATSDPANKSDFVNPKPSKNCDPTKRLRKSAGGQFRFGCGWCNG